jgi:hypothetical protein
LDANLDTYSQRIINGNALLASMVLLDNVQGMLYNGDVAKIQLKRGE